VRLGAREAYEIEIGEGALDALGETARAALSPHARRVALISNARVFELYGERTRRSLEEAGFRVSHWLMGDGERFKSLQTAERALAFLAEQRLERSDAVVALGGGVVGDLAGFAAAIYMRGISFVHAPTTLLAQIDSSVGGKTAVNTKSGKNLVGAFHQPRAVVIDTNTLKTLPTRELTAGWCEAIKQGAVGDHPLFDRTLRFLARENEERRSQSEEIFGARAKRGARTRAALQADDSGASERVQTSDEKRERNRESALVELIAAQCDFKAKVVAGDEREDVTRTDARSRRILNFGHTVAHALETITSYRRFRHGEAVGYGMLAAAEISRRLGLLEASELESLRLAIALAGKLPRADDLDEGSILDALSTDKKRVGGELRWVLLERLGEPRIVGGREISQKLLRASLRVALKGLKPHGLGSKSFEGVR
jgi:3-dehydroquinate synthase